MVATMVDERTFTVLEVAARLRVTEWAVREWLRTGRLRGYRAGGKRAGWRIREHDLQSYIESQMNAPQDDG